MLHRAVRARGCALPAADAVLSRALSSLSLPASPSSSSSASVSLGRAVAALAGSSPSSASSASAASAAPVRKRRHPHRASPSPSPSSQSTRHPHSRRLRTADSRVATLLHPRTPPATFQRACEGLSAADEVALLAGTDPRVWSTALARRLTRGDDDSARALLALAAGFERENASESLWTDLLFTLLRDAKPGGSLGTEDAIVELLDTLRTRLGRRFVGRVAIATANGCANANHDLLNTARLLIRYHLDRLQAPVDANAKDDDGPAPSLPASIVGNLASELAARGPPADVVAFVERELLGHARFDAARDFQQQGFLALFRGYTAAGTAPDAGVNRFLQWTQRLADSRTEAELRSLRLERSFGAAIQSCVAADRPTLALRCFAALRALNDRFSPPRWDLEREEEDLEEDDEEFMADRRDLVAPPDENIFVNVLKASAALQDTGLFKDAYREMAARGVARSAGFGSAVRFCHARGDVGFLERVLGDAFACEAALHGAWSLPIEQYNDALGCLAEAGEYEHARELFETRLLGNPSVHPDHITMLELVESYRGAPRAELFRLMEVFLDEFGLAPNTHVYTSLLAACARQRLAGDAEALLQAMRAHGVTPDVKTLTTAAFISGTQGDHTAVVDLVKAMHTLGLTPDQQFFDYALRALDEAGGVDVCFALLGQVCAAGLAVPEGLYRALLALGTARGLVERSLHVAYNMECDGFKLSSDQMRALAARAASDAEAEQLARTFLLLHGQFLRGNVLVVGRVDADIELQDANTAARFEPDVYDAVLKLLVRYSKKDAHAKVRALADAAGVTLSEDAGDDDAEDERHER